MARRILKIGVAVLVACAMVSLASWIAPSSMNRAIFCDVDETTQACIREWVSPIAAVFASAAIILAVLQLRQSVRQSDAAVRASLVALAAARQQEDEATAAIYRMALDYQNVLCRTPEFEQTKTRLKDFAPTPWMKFCRQVSSNNTGVEAGANLTRYRLCILLGWYSTAMAGYVTALNFGVLDKPDNLRAAWFRDHDWMVREGKHAGEIVAAAKKHRDVLTIDIRAIAVEIAALDQSVLEKVRNRLGKHHRVSL